MTYTLFLDDIRFPADVAYDHRFGPYKDVIICRNYDDAVWLVEQRGLPDFVSFDHDLADEHYGKDTGEKTGYTFAKWLCNYMLERYIDNGLLIPASFDYRVHSMNPVGAENIRQYMDGFLRRMRNIS
jgi:hypothetical protein